jgi:glycosyltransferase involved in cell wall biosynthesis
MNTPKISFIIPVYNTAKYMDECMASVMNQTFKDIEIILVDDGSTDGVSPKMCDDYAAKDERIVVIHKENGGLMSAWIEGTKRAVSDYVCYVDSDDWVDTNMAEELYKHTLLPESEIISSNYIVEKAGERRKETQGLAPGVYTGKELNDVRLNLLGNEIRPVTMSRCMKLISKKLVLDNLKYCDPRIRMSEDLNLTIPCLCDCQRLVIVEEGYFYHYRLVPDSISHGYDTTLLSNLELTDKTFRGILKDKGIVNGKYQADREYVIILFYVLKNELRCQEKDTVSRVQKIFLRNDIRHKIRHTPVAIKTKANTLLYFCMKHPVKPVINITQMILRAYDKKTNSSKN